MDQICAALVDLRELEGAVVICCAPLFSIRPSLPTSCMQLFSIRPLCRRFCTHVQRQTICRRLRAIVQRQTFYPPVVRSMRPRHRVFVGIVRLTTKLLLAQTIRKIYKENARRVV